jgi:hypothetical protein
MSQAKRSQSEFLEIGERANFLVKIDMFPPYMQHSLHPTHSSSENVTSIRVAKDWLSTSDALTCALDRTGSSGEMRNAHKLLQNHVKGGHFGDISVVEWTAELVCQGITLRR